VAAHPFAPFSSACSLGCRAVSFPRRWPRRAPYAAHLRGRHLCHSAWLLIRMPPSLVRARRATASCPSPSPTMLRALAPCAAQLRGSHLHHSLPRRSSVAHRRLGAPLTLPWPLGHTCRGALGLPRPSQGHPRACPMLVVLSCTAARCQPHPDN
jgi:hypothetical protein